MDYQTYTSFGTQHKKGTDSKVCRECGKTFFRDKWVCNNNWKKRKTCGGQCRLTRNNRVRRKHNVAV